MTSSEQEVILSEIASSNFDEAMYQHTWRVIEDKDFHVLLREFWQAREALAEYICWEE